MSKANVNFAASRANASSVMYTNNVGTMYANAANEMYAGAAEASPQSSPINSTTTVFNFSSPTFQVGGVRRFQPAVLRQNTMGWYIEYYAFNPVANGLERKRIRINRERRRARSYAEFRSIASQMIIRLNFQLSLGWSPFVAAAVTMPVAVQPAMGYTAQPVMAQPAAEQAPINYASQAVYQATQATVCSTPQPIQTQQPVQAHNLYKRLHLLRLFLLLLRPSLPNPLRRKMTAQSLSRI